MFIKLHSFIKATINLTKCQQQVHQAGPLLLGKYVPQCTSTGEYEQIQCHGSIGRCWCVNENGEEQDGTRRERGEGKPNCNGT